MHRLSWLGLGWSKTPPRGVWGASGPHVHAPLESWLGAPFATDHPIDQMVLRYLAAFGPATVRDAQTWSGLTRLAEILDRLRPRLATFRDENGAELFDLPDATRTSPRPPGTSTTSTTSCCHTTIGPESSPTPSANRTSPGTDPSRAWCFSTASP
jgi:hypothetical protein